MSLDVCDLLASNEKSLGTCFIIFFHIYENSSSNIKTVCVVIIKMNKYEM